MRTTIYLATACGLAVIQGCDESWVGEVCLNDKQIQCVVADRTLKSIVYCGTIDGKYTTYDLRRKYGKLFHSYGVSVDPFLRG